jgi:hypothetical protein
MSLKKVKLCSPQCVIDNGWHYDEDVPYRCPNLAAAKNLEYAHQLTADAHRKAFDAAKAIIRDAAEHLPELSANSIRSEVEAAQIPGPVVGAAFAALANSKDAPIEASGRYVKSTDPGTHQHRLVVWRSRICKRAAS